MKLGKAVYDEKDETDKRFDCVIDRFDNLDSLVEEQTDTIDEIEKKAGEIRRKLSTVNETLEITDAEIKV